MGVRRELRLSGALAWRLSPNQRVWAPRLVFPLVLPFHVESSQYNLGYRRDMYANFVPPASSVVRIVFG
jgi:hypothetical protein